MILASTQTVTGGKYFTAPSTITTLNSTNLKTTNFTATNSTTTNLVVTNSIQTGGKHWEMIWSTQVVTAVSSITVTGLNGNVDGSYWIKGILISPDVTGGNLFVEISTDTDVNSYRYSVNGSAINTLRGFYFALAGTSANQNGTSQFTHVFEAKSGARRCMLGQIDSDTGVYFTVTNKWLNTVDNITSLTFNKSTISAIGIGTIIEIWAKR